MRVTSMMMLVVLLVRAVFAQEWVEYTGRADRFTIPAPGQPKIETIAWVEYRRRTFRPPLCVAARGDPLLDHRRRLLRCPAVPCGTEPHRVCGGREGGRLLVGRHRGLGRPCRDKVPAEAGC